MTSKFNVIQTGGSIGEIHAAKEAGKWDMRHRAIIVETFNSKEEAHAFAKERRSGLTPTDKSYYKISYKTVEVK